MENDRLYVSKKGERVIKLILFLFCLLTNSFVYSQSGEPNVVNRPAVIEGEQSQMERVKACLQSSQGKDDLYTELNCKIDAEYKISKLEEDMMQSLGYLQLAYPTFKMIHSQAITTFVTTEVNHCRATAQYINSLSATSQIAMLMRISNFIYTMVETMKIYDEMDKLVNPVDEQGDLKLDAPIDHGKFHDLMIKEREVFFKSTELDVAGDTFDLASSSADLAIVIMDLLYNYGFICQPVPVSGKS